MEKMTWDGSAFEFLPPAYRLTFDCDLKSWKPTTFHPARSSAGRKKTKVDGGEGRSARQNRSRQST